MFHNVEKIKWKSAGQNIFSIIKINLVLLKYILVLLKIINNIKNDILII